MHQSPPKTTPLRCIHFPECGGCTELDIPYEEQLKRKHTQLAACFSSMMSDIPPVLSSPQPFYYRHKVQLPFAFAGQGRGGRPLLGCYANDSHRVVDQRMCLIQEEDCSRIAWTVREWAQRNRLSIYNEKTRQGFLRHVLLRRASGTGEVLLGLVTNGGRIAGSRNLSRMLLSMLDEAKLTRSSVVGILQNINTRDTNIVLGSEELVWWAGTLSRKRSALFGTKSACRLFFR